jgi:hypothetical protein
LSSAAWTERESVEVKPAAAAKLVEVFIKFLRLSEGVAGLVSRFIARLRVWEEGGMVYRYKKAGRESRKGLGQSAGP